MNYRVNWSFTLRGSGFSTFDVESEAEASKLMREEWEINAGSFLDSVTEEEIDIESVEEAP